MFEKETNLEHFQKKLVNRRQSQVSKEGGLTGRDDLQPMATSSRIKKFKPSKERVSVSGNVDIGPTR